MQRAQPGGLRRGPRNAESFSICMSEAPAAACRRSVWMRGRPTSSRDGRGLHIKAVRVRQLDYPGRRKHRRRVVLMPTWPHLGETVIGEQFPLQRPAGRSCVSAWDTMKGLAQLGIHARSPAPICGPWSIAPGTGPGVLVQCFTAVAACCSALHRFLSDDHGGGLGSMSQHTTRFRRAWKFFLDENVSVGFWSSGPRDPHPVHTGVPTCSPTPGCTLVGEVELAELSERPPHLLVTCWFAARQQSAAPPDRETEYSGGRFLLTSGTRSPVRRQLALGVCDAGQCNRRVDGKPVTTASSRQSRLGALTVAQGTDHQPDSVGV